MASVRSLARREHGAVQAVDAASHLGKPSVVHARSLTRIYGTGPLAHPALREVDIEVQRGEMLAIMGSSGCGKSTLLNCLAGLDTPTSGEAWLNGANVGAMKEPERTRHRARSAGFVFQAYNLIPVLTAEENVMLPLLARGEDETEARATARDALESLGLEGKERRRPKELSGGEQQRGAIARALAPQPPVVFADEPTGNLDAERSLDVLGLLRDANRARGQTTVIVTHDPNVAAACKRVVHMRNGRIVHGE